MKRGRFASKEVLGWAWVYVQKRKSTRDARNETPDLRGLTCKKEIVGVLHVKNDFEKEVRGWNYVQISKQSENARNLEKKCLEKGARESEITCKKDKHHSLHVSETKKVFFQVGFYVQKATNCKDACNQGNLSSCLTCKKVKISKMHVK